MADATDRLLVGALGALGRRAQERAAEAARYGQRTGRNTYLRHEDGVPISTLVAGNVAYELVGVDAAGLA